MCKTKTVSESEIRAKAKALRERVGGTIFSFPIEEDNPHSEYAVVVYAGNNYFVYPQASDMSLAATGVMTILDLFKKEGIPASYEKDVRFLSYQAQVDAPNVMMRRLKKKVCFGLAKPVYQKDLDVRDGTEETGPLFSARGVLKVNYFSMIDDNLPKAAQFMDKYYELLASRRYGKTASAIKREVRKMSKGDAVRWLEQTYERFIKDPIDIFNIFNGVAVEGQ